jgi:hypothetical protein
MIAYLPEQPQSNDGEWRRGNQPKWSWLINELGRPIATIEPIAPKPLMTTWSITAGPTLLASITNVT